MLLGNWTLQNVTAYRFQNGTFVDSLHTGFQIPIRKKAIHFGYHQVIPIHLASSSATEILLRFRSHRQYPIHCTPLLMPYAEMTMQIQKWKAITNGCIGMLVLLFLYAMMLYKNLQSHVYLFLGLHLLGGIINLTSWTGGFSAILGDHLIWQIPLQQMVTLSSWIFYIYFLIYLLDHVPVVA